MKQKTLLLLTLAFLFACEQKSHKTKETDTITFSSNTNTLNKKQEYITRTVYPCEYDNEVSILGLGLIIAPSEFEMFNDSLLSDTYALVDIYSNDKTDLNICSKYFQPDYGIMHFICLSVTNQSYKVLINYSDVKFLPRTKAYEFITWNNYILQSFGVRRLRTKTGGISSNQPLRKSDNDTTETLTIPQGHELFCPIEVKGDWLKVTYDCFYNDENNVFEGEPCHNYIAKCQNPLLGWLKWKQDNKILIDIFLMP